MLNPNYKKTYDEKEFENEAEDDEKYIQMDRAEITNQNDVNVPATFNLSNTIWEFPIFLVSQLVDNNGTANMDSVNNGPDVGGNVLTSGTMNVPVLLRFTDI